MLSAPTNFLYYNTPADEFQKHYGSVDKPFKHDTTTQLPKIVMIIRAVAALVFSTLFLAVRSVWVLPIAIAGLTFAGWTIYSNMIKKDPLVEAFYKIVGGKEKYDNLPEIKLGANKSTWSSLFDIHWDSLEPPLSKATTKDGRHILVVKAKSRIPEIFWEGKKKLPDYTQAKTIFAFVEKTGANDFPVETDSNFLNETLLPALYYYKLSENNVNKKAAASKEKAIEIRIINSTLSAELANEFFAQQ